MSPNVKVIHVTAKPQERLGLGEAIAAVLTDELRFQWRVAAVVPTMVAFFADMPRRYEVREADIVLERK